MQADVPFKCYGVANADEKRFKEGMKEYERQHSSQGWRRPPLLDLESEYFVLDMLHLKISVVKMLFRHSIQPLIDDMPKADKINDLFKRLHVYW